MRALAVTSPGQERGCVERAVAALTSRPSSPPTRGMLSGPLVALVVLLAAVSLVLGYLYIERRRHHHGDAKAHPHEAARLPLFGTDMLGSSSEREDGPPAPRLRPTPRMHMSPGGTGGSSAVPAVPELPSRRTAWASAAPTAQQPSAELVAHRAPAPVAATVRMGTAPGAPRGIASATVPIAHANAAVADGETVRFAIPDEGTLQFLPGRLEVVAGPDTGRDVRFVRTLDGGSPVEITFGRSEGPAYRHIQLIARTVSRQHATMTLEDDHWSLRNLSATNPVVLNGRPLAEGEVAPLLVDGDRIEMGEVVFVFHSR